MSPDTLKCPKCGNPMERGRLSGIKWISFNSDEERKNVIGKGRALIAHRCPLCSFCELYASDESFGRERSMAIIGSSVVVCRKFRRERQSAHSADRRMRRNLFEAIMRATHVIH